MESGFAFQRPMNRLAVVSLLHVDRGQVGRKRNGRIFVNFEKFVEYKLQKSWKVRAMVESWVKHQINRRDKYLYQMPVSVNVVVRTHAVRYADGRPFPLPGQRQ